MQYRKLGSSVLEVSEISLGSWLTYSGGVAREQAAACVNAAFEAGHQLHRHGERLWPRCGRDAARRGPRRSPARHVRARHEGLLPDDRHRPGSLRGADPQADRRLAGAPSHRLRRPLPVPPLRQRHAAGGDDGGARRGRRAPARPATSASASGRSRRSNGRCASRARREWVSSQPQYSMLWRQPEADLIAAVRRRRHLADRLVAARAGRADRQVLARETRRPPTPAPRARR